MTKLLYHGSNMAVKVPCLQPYRRALDFGRAFYLTSDFEQAAKWAKSAVERRGSGQALVSVFEADPDALDGLKTLRFELPTVEWLRFVNRNRILRLDDAPYDVISGPVANDNTMPVLNLYFKGAYSEEEALKRLLPQRLRDQYAFRTEAALALLMFKEVRSI